MKKQKIRGDMMISIEKIEMQKREKILAQQFATTVTGEKLYNTLSREVKRDGHPHVLLLET